MSDTPATPGNNLPQTTAPKWYQSVPALVSLVFLLAFEGMSAFAGALDQRWQTFGFCFFVVLGFIAAALYCLHAAWRARQKGDSQTAAVGLGAAIFGIATIGSFFHFATDPRVKLFAADSSIEQLQPVPAPPVAQSSQQAPSLKPAPPSVPHEKPSRSATPQGAAPQAAAAPIEKANAADPPVAPSNETPVNKADVPNNAGNVTQGQSGGSNTVNNNYNNYGSQQGPLFEGVNINGAGGGLLVCDPNAHFIWEGGSIISTSPTAPAVEMNSLACGSNPEGRQELDAYRELRADIAAHAGSKKLIEADFEVLKSKLDSLRAPLKLNKDYQNKLDANLAGAKNRFLSVADDKEKTLELLSIFHITQR
jgi:hypothetical protein